MEILGLLITLLPIAIIIVGIAFIVIQIKLIIAIFEIKNNSKKTNLLLQSIYQNSIRQEQNQTTILYRMENIREEINSIKEDSNHQEKESDHN